MLIVFLLLLAIVLTIATIIGIFFVFFQIITTLSGIPYVDSMQSRVTTIIALSGVKKGDRVADLGSGDGRIVIAFAQKGAIAHGYEINLFLVWWSNFKIKKAGLSKQAHVYWKNFWSKDLSSYDIISIYGVPYFMEKLKYKLKKELKPTARIIASVFPFKNIKASKEENFVYVYRRISLENKKLKD